MQVARTLPPYPVGTPGHENKSGTYFPMLAAANAVALKNVQTWVENNHINLDDLALNCSDHRLTILRYLRANNFDVKKATTHMKENIDFRCQRKISELILKSPQEILGFGMKELTAIFPHCHYGFDKTGRPVVYKQYGKFDATKIKALAGGNFDNLVNYHIWEQEAVSYLCSMQTQRRNELVETISGIVDVKDMKMSQITRDFLYMTKLLAEIDQKQYPETMGRIYILNVPMVFPAVWRIVRPWIDPITAAKIVVLGDKREYEPILADFIGKENLPADYGGDLPALSMENHPYAQYMKTREDELAIKTLSSSSSSSSSSSAVAANEAAAAVTASAVTTSEKTVDTIAAATADDADAAEIAEMVFKFSALEEETNTVATEGK